MAKPFGVWGIDIGQCALKALRLEMVDGQPTATAFDYIEHPKILSQPDADPESLIRESLEKFLGRNPIGKDQVAVSIAGQSGLVRFVKLPPVEEKKVPDIVKFEARQQIPFPLEEVVWDYQKIGGGETVGGFAMETEIGLFAMKRDIISKHLAYYQGTKTEVHAIQMTPLALTNFATYELLKKGGVETPAPEAGAEGVERAEEAPDDTPRGKKRCAVVLDIGTDNSNLIITDGGKVIWQRTVNVGGSHFTKALTKEMKLTFAKAEHLKRNAAKSPELAQILRALRPVLTEFVGEVQRSLGFFTNTHRDAHVAYLVGLGSAFKLPGLQKYLSEKLSLEVRKPARFDRIAGDTVLADPTFSDNLLTFPVAYGLAVQGLGLSRLKTNLLPNEVRVDRLIRAKKPAVAAAAAALLLGTGFLSLGFGMQLSAVNDKVIDAGINEAKSAATAAKAQDAELARSQAEIKAGEDAIKAIVVGADERLNWIRLQEVLSAVLPRPGYYDPKTKREVNNTNLTEVVRDGDLVYDQAKFWDYPEGQRAVEKYRERLSVGVPLEKLYDDDLAEHLATVNIETVYCRYAPSLATFFETADKQVYAELQLSIADTMLEGEREEDATTKKLKPKPPEGGGWVFELRGYTYHKEGVRFIQRGLLRNLQRFDKIAPDATAKIAKIIPDGTDPVRPAPGPGDAKKEIVSHAFLMLQVRDIAPQPGVFQQINTSRIDMYIGGGAAAGGLGMPGPGMPGPVAPPGPGIPAPGGEAAPAAGGAAKWTPLLAGGAAAGPGALGAGGLGGPGRGPVAPPPGPPVAPGPAPGSPTQPGAAPAPGGKKPKDRYEFVICFVWREPTPTDPTPAADAAPPPTTPTR